MPGENLLDLKLVLVFVAALRAVSCHLLVVGVVCSVLSEGDGTRTPVRVFCPVIVPIVVG